MFRIYSKINHLILALSFVRERTVWGFITSSHLLLGWAYHRNGPTNIPTAGLTTGWTTGPTVVVSLVICKVHGCTVFLARFSIATLRIRLQTEL